jgi:hypothetical protein
MGKGPGCCDPFKNDKEWQKVSFMDESEQGTKTVDLILEHGHAPILRLPMISFSMAC